MAFFTKSGGIWRTIQNFWVKQSGSWRKVQNAWIKQGGVWRQFYSAVTLPSSFEVFMVGGAGRGAGTGGGGGGGVRGWTTYTPSVQSYPVVVGAATSNTSGGNIQAGTSSININGTLISVTGGFNSSNTTGGSQGAPNSRSGGTGNVASNRNWCCGPITYGGGGGGHSANGTNVTTGVIGPCGQRTNRTWYWGGCGGEGFTLDSNTAAILTSIAGTSQTTVGSGGGGRSTGGSCSRGSCPSGPGGTGAGDGAGGNATMYGCGGGGLGGLGRGGVVMVRYNGSVRLGNGGTAIYRSADNKTYHVFTASGTLTF